MTTLPYDKTSPSSIEKYARNLEQLTFREVLPDNVTMTYTNKGGLGLLLEEHYFYYKPNNEASPDFDEAGVELKVTPYKRNQNKTFSAKERLVLNIINYEKIITESFETSSFWNKNQVLLLILYLYEKEKYRLDYLITHAQLFSFPEKDLKIIKDDWHKIKQKVLEGKAHELSESDTNYLSACTKGANKESVREQPFADFPAKQRAFSLKSSYMTYVLRNYVLAKKPTYHHSIVENLEDQTLEEYVLSRFNHYKGKTLDELISTFKLEDNRNSKSITYLVASKIVNENLSNLQKAEEFQKANIKVKAIRIRRNGKIPEDMSFPTFKYDELVEEEWENSTLRTMFLETRYLFIVFKETKNYQLILEKALFWNIPIKDLENDVRTVWEETVNRIKSGKADSLPRKTEFKVSHVRPHARNSKDTYPTPYGTQEVKKCFWLNREYIVEQIAKHDSKEKSSFTYL